MLTQAGIIVMVCIRWPLRLYPPVAEGVEKRIPTFRVPSETTCRTRVQTVLNYYPLYLCLMLEVVNRNIRRRSGQHHVTLGDFVFFLRKSTLSFGPFFFTRIMLGRSSFCFVKFPPYPVSLHSV